LLIYRELADRCAAALPGFRATYFVEGTDGAEGRQDGLRTGRLDIATISGELAPATDWTYYLSGPKAMITAFRQQLISRFTVAEFASYY